MRRIATLLLTPVVAVGTLVAVAPAASAQVYCNDNDQYRVTQHQDVFIEVDRTTMVNNSGSSATLQTSVGASHTTGSSFTGSITASVKGGFWVFAEASASTTASKTIQSSYTMTASYTASATVPAHTTRTVRFGFRRYNQYIQRYYLYNTSTSTCGVKVLNQGWVIAPYTKAFIVS